MERAARLESKSSGEKSSLRRALIATGALLATGVALAAAFFPLMFNRWLPRDDEGVFIFALRESIAKHGHLYSTIWSDLYGPFYYGFMSTVYRVIHQQPTAANGRWIVLVLTTASAVFFGAAVWRVTKNLPATLVCEVAAFMLLIPAAGSEPMHPGSLGVFLVSVVAFELSSYAATRRTAHLVGIGLATGAAVMTKVNAGGLVAIAVLFVFVVGNKRTPRWMQIVVAVLVAPLPDRARVPAQVRVLGRHLRDSRDRNDRGDVRPHVDRPADAVTLAARSRGIGCRNRRPRFVGVSLGDRLAALRRDQRRVHPPAHVFRQFHGSRHREP